jgi:hypothetical protein
MLMCAACSITSISVHGGVAYDMILIYRRTACMGHSNQRGTVLVGHDQVDGEY